MGDTQAIDAMVSVLTDPFGIGHMGITAENLAAKHGFTREDQDAFAVESQKRAVAAIAEGRFKSQIAPITLKTRKGDVVFDTDEHPKASVVQRLELATREPDGLRGLTAEPDHRATSRTQGTRPEWRAEGHAASLGPRTR